MSEEIGEIRGKDFHSLLKGGKDGRPIEKEFRPHNVAWKEFPRPPPSAVGRSDRLSSTRWKWIDFHLLSTAESSGVCGRTDCGSCDDFHFSGLIESVSRAIAALIEWAYLTDLSAGAELTYLPFAAAACREICSRCRSAGKESPWKNGMDAPIEFAAAPLLKEGKRRKKTDQYRGQRRKACMLRNPCKWARNASLARQPSRCSKYKATRTDRRTPD